MPPATSTRTASTRSSISASRSPASRPPPARAPAPNLLINNTIGGEHTTSTTISETSTQQYDTRTIAEDDSGDFAVVWVSYGQEYTEGRLTIAEDPYAATTPSIYMRMYDRNNDPLGWSSTLTGTISATATTLPVQSLTGFNYPTPCTIIVGSETMLVESVSNGVMTVVRGWDGTTATTHASGVKVMVGDIPVNTFANGDQINPSIAMDADGEFVVTWLGENRATGQWNIYAQRYNSTGEPVGSEFQVNTKVTNNLVNPQVAATAVAMNAFGQFVIVWAMMGQSFSYFNTMEGQVYNSDGQAVGSEFQVNSINVPGVGSTPAAESLHPSVAMNDAGGFVVTWNAVTSQVNGYATNTIVVARLFDQYGNPVTTTQTGANGQQTQSNVEFQVNIGSPAFISDYQHLADHHLPDDNNSAGSDIAGPTQSTAQNPQVAMDSAGNFIITWEMFEDNDVVENP